MQKFKQRYLMLFATPYSIGNEDGSKNEGVSSYFIYDDSLAPRVDEEAVARGQTVLGIKPAKMNLPYSAAEKIKIVPGFYDCECKMVMKRVEVRGSAVEMPTMQITDIEFVSSVDAKPGMISGELPKKNT